MNYITVTKLNIEDCLKKYDVLICRIRPSRVKAKQWAVLEVSAVLAPMGAVFITNTPIGDVRGLVGFFVPKNSDALLCGLLNNLGYCYKFYKLSFNTTEVQAPSDLKSINPFYWKGRPFIPVHFFTIDEEAFEAQSISSRLFAVYSHDKTIKYIKGYRGDGSETGRRALPLEDARLMANLASLAEISRLLDPFAGGGSIIHAAKCINPNLYLISADIDSAIEPGLKMYASEHHTCDARVLELGAPVDAIVTEVPFSVDYNGIIGEALSHLLKYLSEDGRLVLMCHQEQYDKIAPLISVSNKLYPIFHKDINRKGTPITVSYWTKDRVFYESSKAFITTLRGFI